MIPKTELFSYGPEDEGQRFATHLEKLIQHLSDDDFAVVGSVAIRYHATTHGLAYPDIREKDLDLIIKDISTLHPSVTDDLLISHYHPPKDSYYFIVKTVDPVSKTYTNLFPYFPSSAENFITVKYRGRNVQVVGVEDQLIKTVLDCQRISEKQHVDPKQFMELDLLLQMANLHKANRLWQEKIYQYYPYSMSDGINKGKTTAAEHPEWLEDNPFKNEPLAHCQECIDTPEFPIASPEAVRQALRL